MRVFIPAMDKRSALTAARSLGRHNAFVIGGATSPFCSGFYSKFCHTKVVYRSPFENLSHFCDDIERVAQDHSVDCYLPVNDETLLPILSEEKRFRSLFRLPAPPLETYLEASDKIRSYKMAEEIGIPVSSAHFFRCDTELTEDLRNLESTIRFPIIIRPNQSRRIENNQLKAGHSLIIQNLEGLRIHLGRLKKDGFSAIVQEYFHGQGYGYYAIVKDGRVLSSFQMRRLHEIPWYGGPSSYRESVYDPVLDTLGRKILERLGWHGVAMVEFRYNPHDRLFYFIEVNGRLWGSLNLPITLGLDFPVWLLQLEQGLQVPVGATYESGRTSRWLPGELLWLKSVMGKQTFQQAPGRVQAILDFMKYSFQKTTYDLFDREDLLPALTEIPITILKKVFHRKRKSVW